MTVGGCGYDEEGGAWKWFWWAVVGLECVEALGGRLGSCLRRNDGKGRQREGGWVLCAARYPRRGAGMTELLARV